MRAHGYNTNDKSQRVPGRYVAVTDAEHPAPGIYLIVIDTIGYQGGTEIRLYYDEIQIPLSKSTRKELSFELVTLESEVNQKIEDFKKLAENHTTE